MVAWWVLFNSLSRIVNCVLSQLFLYIDIMFIAFIDFIYLFKSCLLLYHGCYFIMFILIMFIMVRISCLFKTTMAASCVVLVFHCMQATRPHRKLFVTRTQLDRSKQTERKSCIYKTAVRFSVCQEQSLVATTNDRSFLLLFYLIYPFNYFTLF